MSDVKPAMTAEEWTQPPHAVRDGWTFTHEDAHKTPWLSVGFGDEEDGHAFSAETFHALAALALHGQDFGFTWEDVDTLRSQARWLPASQHRAEFVMSDLADRIAALLPPR